MCWQKLGGFPLTSSAKWSMKEFWDPVIWAMLHSQHWEDCSHTSPKVSASCFLNTPEYPSSLV